MTRILITSLLATCLLATGCARDNGEDTGPGPEALYERGQRMSSNGDYVGAVGAFEDLETRYPFHPLAKQAQLEQIYAWFQAGNIEAADSTADRFIRENPRHESVDYAYYLKGLIFFDEAPDMLERLFRSDLSRRPIFFTEQSFRNFKTFLERYPDSTYADDARQRMVFLRERLARFELHVARYYMRRGAWLAAANRARGILERYDGTGSMPDALEVMVLAYERLELTSMAEDARRVWTESFPEFEGNEDNRG
jgi:outer membrane protein assembly factor BamD